MILNAIYQATPHIYQNATIVYQNATQAEIAGTPATKRRSGQESAKNYDDQFGDLPEPYPSFMSSPSRIAISTSRESRHIVIDATRKLAGEGFKRPWPPLIRMSEVRREIDAQFGTKP